MNSAIKPEVENVDEVATEVPTSTRMDKNVKLKTAQTDLNIAKVENNIAKNMNKSNEQINEQMNKNNEILTAFKKL